MRNKYLVHAHISEVDFRAVLRCFGHDLPALTAAKFCGLRKNTTHRLYTLLRERVGTLAEAQTRPFVGGSVEADESYFGPRRVRGWAENPGHRVVETRRQDVCPDRAKRFKNRAVKRGPPPRERCGHNPHRRLEGA